MKARVAGFTLLEMVIALVVIASLAPLLAGAFAQYQTASRAAYQDKHRLNDQQIASALLHYAATQTALGTLPAAYSGAGYTSTVYNPGDTSAGGLALTQALTQSGVAPGELNDDGTTGRRVRVYQRVDNLVQQVPLYFQSGPLVALRYQFGAVYVTACPWAETVCNPTAATGVPGSSPVLTGANYQTWSTSGTDLPPAYLSSLPLQKNMLATTVQRLDKVRDALLAYLRAQQVTAAGGDATNWYPGTGLGGAAPASNQGCRDGWYDLSSTTVLPTVGLTTAEFGRSAWGAPVQFCRDYDPTGTKAPNASPHYGAIRIHASVSQGLAPDAAVTGNNVVLSF